MTTDCRLTFGRETGQPAGKLYTLTDDEIRIAEEATAP